MNLKVEILQKDFAGLIGVSEAAVSGLVERGVIIRGQSGAQWLRDYCEHLREVAAGRASGGDLNLVQERARLAKEQADEKAMKNAITRQEFAPLLALEMATANVGRQIAEILQRLPVLLKRRAPNLSGTDLELIATEIALARNLAADIKIDLGSVYGDSAPSSGGESGAEDPGRPDPAAA